MDFSARLMQLDRRWVFLGIALAVAVPYLIPGFALPSGEISPRTQVVYDAINKLPAGSALMISFDYGPSSAPEIQPMAEALLRQAFARKLRVLGVALVPEGALQGNLTLSKVAVEFQKRPGVDYVYLGYKPSTVAVIKGIGTDINKVFPTDFSGKTTATLPAMHGVRNYKDIGFLVALSSTPLPGAWIAFAHQQYGVKMAVGVTAVMATDFYPYLQSQQIVGLLNGLKGAAEYEQLIGHPSNGMSGMSGQSVAHLWIILTVIIGNIGYFVARSKARR